MLGAQSTGIDPVNQPVTLRVAEFSLTIPRNSFKRTLSGAFAFEGIVDGRRIEASIVPSLVSRTFGFEFEVATTDPTGGQIVVPVMLSIGHDSGTANGRVERKE
jgi:hypothetical protein